MMIVGRKMKRATFATSTGIVIFAMLVSGPPSNSAVAYAPPDLLRGGKQILLDAAPLDTDEKLPEKFEPNRPRTEAEQARIDAMAWFMAGSLKEARNDQNGAYQAYHKAVELDPKSTDIYRALVPLAFRMGKTREALQYALKLVELDPNDYQLMGQLAGHMIRQNKVAEAIHLLEQARESSALEKHSESYIKLTAELAALYRQTSQPDKAADASEILFDALLNPKKYQLEFRTRAALLAHPQTNLEQIGQTFLAAGRTEAAIKAFEAAAKERKGSAGHLSFNLARVYRQTGQLDKALAEILKYIDAQLQSKGRDAYQLLADILKDLDRADELISMLETNSAEDARNATLQYFLAEQYSLADRLTEAEELYKKTLQESGDSRGHIGLASVYRRQNKADELLEALTAALKSGQELDRLQEEFELVGQDDKLLENLIAVGHKILEADEAKLGFPSTLILAKLSASGRKTDATIEFYRRALGLKRDRAVLIYRELGDYLLDVENYSEAAKLFAEAADDSRVSRLKMNYLYRLSQAHQLNGDTPAALAAIDRAIKSNPDTALLHFQKALIHYYSRRLDEAIPLFEEVITRFPDDEAIVRRARFTLSNVYVLRGEISKGEEILEQIFAGNPDDPSVNNDLGYLYADQGKNLEQAEKMIRKAIAAEPENAAYLDSMGWVLFKLKRYDDAIPHLEKATTLPTGGDATIWDHLGDCYIQLQKESKATEAWKKAIELGEKSTRPDKELLEKIRNKLNDNPESKEESP